MLVHQTSKLPHVLVKRVKTVIAMGRWAFRADGWDHRSTSNPTVFFQLAADSISLHGDVLWEI